MTYQSVWSGGRETAVGERDCSGRYEAIARELRPSQGFSGLDVGAYSGYFSIRLAEEFGANMDAFDRFRGLPDGVLTFKGSGGTVTGHRRLLGTADVIAMKRAHYDVVLLLSVLHHMRDWRPFLASVIRHEPKVMFIELPDEREILPNAVAHASTAEMHAAVKMLGGIVVAWTPGYDKTRDRPLYAVGRIHE